MVIYPYGGIDPGQTELFLYSLYTEIAEGNQELAVERHESLTQLSLSCLSTMVDTPITSDPFLYSLYTEIAEGNQELAVERHESLTQLSLSCLCHHG